jgi:hypothetical protein
MLTHAVVTPPVLSSVPLPVIRSHCRITHTWDDDLLTMYAQSATALVEAYTGRSLITQTLRMTSTATLPPASIPLSNGPLMVYPLWFNTILTTPYRRVEFIRSPVSTVRSLTLTHGDGTTDTLDPSTYLIDAETDPAAILFTGYTLLPQDRLTALYDAGYGTDPTSVPSALRNAVMWLIGYMYSHRGDDEINEMPKLARHLCDPYRIFFFGGIAPDGR